MHRLVEEGVVEKYGDRRGCFRPVESDIELMNFARAPTIAVPIRYPFEIERWVETMPGNIIVIAGEVNAGKTAFCLNMARLNQELQGVHYFSSEMGAAEMRKRLEKFGDPLESWKIKAYERSEAFADVIMPGQGYLNIVDFLELHDNFYEVGGRLAEIHRKLKGAVAVVALQKNPGTDVGLGGFRGMEKPRLYLSMGKGVLKIVKGKIWASVTNPNGLEIRFKLADGCKLIPDGEWGLAGG